jgi:hypothetical protein
MVKVNFHRLRMIHEEANRISLSPTGLYIYHVYYSKISKVFCKNRYYLPGKTIRIAISPSILQVYYIM